MANGHKAEENMYPIHPHLPKLAAIPRKFLYLFDTIVLLITIISRYPMPPPKLARDAPIVHIFHPVHVYFKNARAQILFRLPQQRELPLCQRFILTNHCFDVIGSTVVPQR